MTSTVDESRLAVDGGAPVRTEPFPARQPFSEEGVALAAEAIRSGSLSGSNGRLTTRFEREVADLYGARHAVAVSSGTASIHTALAALDPAPGSEVISAPITDAGSIAPVLFQGCVPVFADLDAHLGMDPDSVERLITPRTVAIVAVHLFGNATDVRRLREIADRHGIALLEDCSQAHVTRLEETYLGRYGHIGMFSMQQSKHMTTGDGGFAITDDDALADGMRRFRDKGWARQGFGPRSYPSLGLNYRITELQAAVAIPQLSIVASVVERRQRFAAVVDAVLASVPGVSTMTAQPGCAPSYWCYPFFVDDWPVDRFCEALAAEGVPTQPGYIGEAIYSCMAPLRDRATFGGSGYPLTEPAHPPVAYPAGLCPVAEDALRRLVVFWAHEDMTEQDARDVGAAIAKVATAFRG